MKLKRLSATLLIMGMRCPMQLWHYLTVGPRPPGFAAAFGTAVHKAVETDLRAVKEGRQIDLEELTSCFETAFCDELLVAERRDDELCEGEYLDLGVQTVKAFHRRQTPWLKPVEVELPLVVDLGVIDMSLRIDLVDKRLGLVDHKTAWRKWRAGREHEEMQPLAYAVPFFLRTRRVPRFAFNIIYPNLVPVWQLNENAAFEVRQTQPSESAVKAFIRAAENVAVMMIEERPIPNPAGWWCGRKWCGWWDICPFGRAKRVSIVVP